MRIVSLNVGMPKLVATDSGMVSTGIFKSPVAGPLLISGHNLAGDGQADLRVHGGRYKAIYGYPSEHYQFWKGELPDWAFAFGHFGENLTTEGLLEGSAFVGNVYRTGTAEIQISQPRQPCFKLGLRFGRADMVKRFADSLRCGFYFSVRTPGEISAGDSIELIHEDPHGFSITDAFRLMMTEKSNRELLKRAVKVEALSESWRQEFQERLAGLR